ncbi:MAG: ROK family transcriptional regulator [Actinomycetaceae bacterium]|nr:ROK family transcriptional regulator [Actinomycetaceae bacterium]
MHNSSLRPEHIRESNIRLVLAAALGANEPASRAKISSTTGITRATVSRLADELVDAGILDELPPPPATGPGRPALGLVGSSRVIGIGADIDVDALRVRAIDLGGNHIALQSHFDNFSGSNPEKVIQILIKMLNKIVRELPSNTRIFGPVVAVPGLVEQNSNLLLDAPNLGWQDVDVCTPIKEAFSDTHHRSVLSQPVLHNEANLSALTAAFSRPGAPTKFRHFVYISGGTGIGAAIFNEGKLWGGANGWSGEIGHLTIDPNGPVCRCGSTGCLERYIGREALTYAFKVDHTNPAQLDASARALGISIAALVNLLDIPQFVLGGQLSELLARRRQLIETELQRRSMAARRTSIAIQSAKLGEDAASLGAAYASLTKLIAEPAAYL